MRNALLPFLVSNGHLKIDFEVAVVKKYNIFLQRSSRGLAKRRKVFTVRPCTFGLGERHHELHAADEVHDQQYGRHGHGPTCLQEAQSQLTILPSSLGIINFSFVLISCLNQSPFYEEPTLSGVFSSRKSLISLRKYLQYFSHFVGLITLQHFPQEIGIKSSSIFY